MPLLAFPAVFMRGGTSRAIMFHAKDLPPREEWDPIFLGRHGQSRPERAAVERHGRRDLLAVESLRAGAVRA